MDLSTQLVQTWTKDTGKSEKTQSKTEEKQEIAGIKRKRTKSARKSETAKRKTEEKRENPGIERKRTQNVGKSETTWNKREKEEKQTSAEIEKEGDSKQKGKEHYDFWRVLGFLSCSNK